MHLVTHKVPTKVGAPFKAASIMSDQMCIKQHICTGKPPPGSRNQWFSDQLVNGSILGCWLQVAGDLVTYWLPGY